MNNNRAGRDLALFLLGIAMCAGGLYLFLSNVEISTNLWGRGSGVTYFGLFKGNGIPSGMITIPFILGIVCMFFAPRSLWAKLLTGLGVLVILLGVISSTDMRFKGTTAFNYLLMVILIFGGAAMVLRILLVGTYADNDDKKSKGKDSGNKSVDDMLNDMKK